MATEKSLETRLAIMDNKLDYIAKKCDSSYAEIISHSVPLEAYRVLESDVKLLKTVVFGFIGVVLVGVVGALLSLVIIK